MKRKNHLHSFEEIATKKNEWLQHKKVWVYAQMKLATARMNGAHYLRLHREEQNVSCVRVNIVSLTTSVAMISGPTYSIGRISITIAVTAAYTKYICEMFKHKFQWHHTYHYEKPRRTLSLSLSVRIRWWLMHFFLLIQFWFGQLQAVCSQNILSSRFIGCPFAQVMRILEVLI